MIAQLSIKNYALIDDINVNFDEGFTVITGETGAGKSIILDAVSLLLGNRAEINSVKDPSKKCVIEATFNIKNYKLHELFKTLDIDYENLTIIRREIIPSGKSRAFVNDTPVNLTTLTTLADHLIDIHSQHQTLEVFTQNFQFEIIDALAGTKALIEKYQHDLANYKDIQRELVIKISEKQDRINELDYNKYLLEELLSANLKPGEVETLELEQTLLSNQESIQINLEEAIQLYSNEQVGIQNLHHQFKYKLTKLKEYAKLYETLWERAQSIQIEFDDIYEELIHQHEQLNQDPDRLQAVEDRLQLFSQLFKKHQQSTVEDLVQLQNELSKKVKETESIDQTIEILESKVKEIKLSLNTTTKEITQKRLKVIPDLTSKLQIILSNLGLIHARFKITITQATEFLIHGKDNLQFLFTANKGSDFGQLKKTASGGELSRIMLALKSILANYKQLPTIIFDEIDTGVSGEIAFKMAEELKEMSTNMQVISITHLPQIAAKANHHFKVYKEVKNEVTFTQLKLLKYDERVEELTSMISGDKKSQSAHIHAKELLN